MEDERRPTWTPLSVVATAASLAVLLVLAVLVLRPLLPQGPGPTPSPRPATIATSSPTSSPDEALCEEVLTATRTVFEDYPGGNDDLDAAGSERLDAAVTALGDVCPSSTDAAFQRDELLPWLNGTGVQPVGSP